VVLHKASKQYGARKTKVREANTVSNKICTPHVGITKFSDFAHRRVSEKLCYSEHETMNKVQKLSYAERYTPSPQSFRTDMYLSLLEICLKFIPIL
jgi:hypothetical protein